MLRLKCKIEVGPFEISLMRFTGIRLVEKTKQNVRRIRVCLEEKQKVYPLFPF